VYLGFDDAEHPEVHAPEDIQRAYAAPVDLGPPRFAVLWDSRRSFLAATIDSASPATAGARPAVEVP
jgi:hypothetical protein